MAEVLAATALMSVVAAIVLPMVAGVAAVREEAAQRQIAVLEVANVLERIASIRRNQALTDELLSGVSLPEDAARQFDDPQLSVVIAEPAGSPPARELRVSLSWRNDAGERVAPVAVTAFLYEHEVTR